jgi:hypothetical protein
MVGDQGWSSGPGMALVLEHDKDHTRGRASGAPRRQPTQRSAGGSQIGFCSAQEEGIARASAIVKERYLTGTVAFVVLCDLVGGKTVYKNMLDENQ